MKPAGHVMILASAGSGKTYALTNRFVQLLALGARPERIAALTFTRKAAGEFFDEILHKLARAAREPAFAAKIAAEIGAPELGPADFLALLRSVADAMPRLRLGTLDSFFARVARAFPFELGLAGEFEILQEHAARTERARVLRRMFARAGGLADAQREFIEAFKRATFGAEEKRLGLQLDGFIDRHEEVFLAAPDRDLWGNPRRIWPEGCPWPDGAAGRAAAAQALGAALAAVDMNDRQRARWEAFFADLAGWTPGAPLGGGLEYVVANAFKAWPALEEITVERKKLPLPPAARAALHAVVAAVAGAEFARRMEMTRGVHAVLAGYEAVYHDAVRRAGRLTFADVQRLLLPRADGAGALAQEGAGDGRLLIDYRLDGQIDHWLLDEFQDTSFGQWSVLRTLIDEAVQDPSGRRSFFYVGDVKQAIFAWREGDPRLFREIFDHYNAAQPGAIAEERLVESWRSGPAVIATVNRVFGAAEELAELFPGEASAAWNREWRAHASARPELGGHAAWLHAEGAEARFATALALLQETDPLGRGLSCALLVQRNDTAAELADYLRREGGLPALAESDLHVCTDNPLGSALLALMQAAAHPGDTLAQAHVRMTPLGARLAAEGLATPEALTRSVLGQIHREGFERTAAAWLRRLEPHLAPDDGFSRERARQFTAAAAAFDATGRREVAEFVAFMERHTVREAETAAVLRVMTIHKAKGLGFDLVILPDLEGVRLDSRREGLAVRKAADRTVEWVLDPPARLFCEQDPVLAAYVRSAEAEACYESLSLLYVAMTRAKRAMYLVTKPPGASASRNYPKLLTVTLGDEAASVRVGRREFAGGFAAGDSDWAARLAPPAAPERPSAGIGRIDAAGRSPRLPARRPSAGRQAELPGAPLFALEGGGSAAAFGTTVHGLLAEVEEGGAEAARRLAAAWRARGVPARAAAEAQGCLEAPALAAVWARPARADVWRERAFEAVIDGAWVTGVFDRVVVERDAAGRPARATVYDFKTDFVADAAQAERVARRHAEQMGLYRRVAARLTGLPEERVGAEVVFTAARAGVRLWGAA